MVFSLTVAAATPRMPWYFLLFLRRPARPVALPSPRMFPPRPRNSAFDYSNNATGNTGSTCFGTAAKTRTTNSSNRHQLYFSNRRTTVVSQRTIGRNDRCVNGDGSVDNNRAVDEIAETNGPVCPLYRWCGPPCCWQCTRPLWPRRTTFTVPPLAAAGCG